MMTDHELLLTGVCLVLFGFTVGMMLFLLVRHLLFPEEAYAPKKRLSYKGNVRHTVSVLQLLQVLIGREAAERDPSLADLVRLLRSAQREFGRSASLEGVIQALVAQDAVRQRANRRQVVTRQREAVTLGRQEVMIG